MSLINREALYEKVCGLEAQALSYIEKIIHDEDKVEEWKIWSAILTERTAFKHDIFDAPEVKPERKTGRWIIKDNPGTGWYRITCSERGEDVTSTAPCIGFYPNAKVMWNYCPDCGTRMEGDGMNDKEIIRQELEQKCWIPDKTNEPAKRLNDLIFDINPAEICAQIEADNLKKWCEIIQVEMKMAMVQLPCWGG